MNLVKSVLEYFYNVVSTLVHNLPQQEFVIKFVRADRMK
jgi:hypothetical protein